MAKVGKCVSPLQCFKISASILFFWMETSQPYRMKFLQNIIQTEKKNNGSFWEITSIRFPVKNKVWREVCNVATGDTHFPTLAIDIQSLKQDCENRATGHIICA